MLPTGVGLDDIAERLRLTRIALGLTQASIGRLAGISYQAWNNYEKARKRISIDQALLLCRSTGLTLDWIYQGDIRSLPHDFVLRLNAADGHGEQPKRRKRA